MLLATLYPAMAETADNPVVVRVGDFTYTQSVLQGSLDSMIELSRMLSGDAPIDEERELLNAAALRYYQMEKLNDLIDGWQGDYEIETHTELLKY